MPPSPFERILIIRPSALGDVARSVPVLASLKRAFPEAQIDWLVQDGFADVIAAHPALRAAVPFPRRDFSRWVKGVHIGPLREYLKTLRDRGYDLAIDCQGLARSGLFAWSTRARRRIGHARAREFAWLAYTDRVKDNIETHTVDRMLSLVDHLGITALNDADAMRLYTPATGRGFAAAANLTPRRYAVLAPTSRWLAKQWPDDRFAALARELADDGIDVAIVGAAGERGQIPDCLAAAGRHDRIQDFTGRTTIAQLMDLIEHAALVVANDSAALHIAVGFARPIVALFGPTRVNRVGPYRREADVIQHITKADRLDHKTPAGRLLMSRITLDEVLAAARARVGR